MEEIVLSVLAARFELDAFTNVDEAIDDLIIISKNQQTNEVTKSDWCVTAIQNNKTARNNFTTGTQSHGFSQHR